MGDAGEGIVDADARIQERRDELERERAEKLAPEVRDPESRRTLESLRLARADLERQLAATAHERRRSVIAQAIEEIDRRIAEVGSLQQVAEKPIDAKV